jgi:phenylalanyl-tRNA synthetase beta chain
MEFSLKKISKKVNFSKISLSNIINTLNLIGFEVDDLIQETDSLIHTKNIKLIVKIPADRPDLLMESFFISDFRNLFKAPLISIYKTLLPIYKLNKNKKDSNTLIQNRLIIPEKLQTFSTSIIGVKILNIQFSPKWIQIQLQEIGLTSQNNIQDVFSLINYELGHNFNSFLMNETNSETKNLFSIKKLEKSQNFLDTSVAKDAITLINTKEEIISIFGYRNSFLGVYTDDQIMYIHSFISDKLVSCLEKNSVYLKSISTKELKTTYTNTLNQAFSRLLTILELSYNIQEISYHSQTKPTKLFSSKIRKLDKIFGKNILGINSYDLSIFQKTGLKLICETPNAFYFNIPYNRKDLDRQIDIVEEYSRFFGYKNFIEKIPFKNIVYSKKKFHNISFIKQFFLNYGFSEVITNPFESNKKKGKNLVQLENPLNSEISILHDSLIHKIFDLFEKNLRINNEEKNYFEINRVFYKRNNSFYEIDKLAGVFQNSFYNSSLNSNLEFFYSKGLLETFLANFGFKDISMKKQLNCFEIFHKTRAISIYNQNELIGIFGEINPLYFKKLSLKRKVYFFEFNLFPFTRKKIVSKVKRIEELTKNSFIKKDLSFFMEKTIDFKALKETIQKTSKHINRVEFFDIYIEPNNKEFISIGIRLTYPMTLQLSQIEEINHEIVKTLKLNYKINSK